MKQAILLSVFLGLGGGCASPPSISANKAAQVAETFEAYAGAVGRMRGYWEEGVTDEELTALERDLAATEEALRAEASNVKLEVTVERLEGVGTALTAVPHPFAKVAGWVVLLGAGLLGIFGRKKKPAGVK